MPVSGSLPLLPSVTGSFLFYFILLYVSECSAYMHVFVPHTCLISEEVRRVSDPFDWSEASVSSHVNAEFQIQVL